MAKTSYLPPEIIEAILLKSSVKSLLRFKLVSKSWNTLISDPLFVENHHRNSKSSNSQDLFICDLPFPRGFTLVKLEDQKLEIVKKLETPPYDCRYFVCHCQGVILLTNSRFNSHVLWNPSTQTQTKFLIPYTRGIVCYGLCHDPNTDDFKVVTVDRDYYSVFSCTYKSWIITKEKITHPYTGFHHKIQYRGVCVNGAIYWVWLRENVQKIIYYDPRDDKFKRLEKPENLDERRNIYLGDLGGYLCLHSMGQDVFTIKIWIKEKGIDNNSWKDLMIIENVKMGIRYFEPQCLMGNKIVIRNKNNLTLVVYNPLEKTFQQFEDTKLMFPGLVPYLDSPFFPGTQNHAQE